ncbi:acyl carrier protein [Natrinema sp. SYSU A 869]|uniref:acyl carrier protein n=1 Tax=Natrinema sp. SYSU A 869 TaxID=2871694 RepID=UPI001CA41BB6|nr:acyl carrier protein [Natrinema sp. SYSU A 869]
MSTKAESTVDEIVTDRLSLNEDAFDDGTRFKEDLDAESLDIVEVAEAIEATVGVHVPDDDLEDLATVGDLKAYVAERAD